MLDKAIKHGKEHRVEYRKSKRFDRTCRCHGSCDWCRNNRTAKELSKRRAADQAIREHSEG
jgi:hypothetical protein